MRLDSSTFKLYEYHSSRYLICQSQHKMDIRPYLDYYMVLCLIAVSCNFNRTKGPRQGKDIKVDVDYRMITEMRNITEVLWTSTPTHPTISYIELVVRDKNNLNKTYCIVLY